MIRLMDAEHSIESPGRHLQQVRSLSVRPGAARHIPTATDWAVIDLFFATATNMSAQASISVCHAVQFTSVRHRARGFGAPTVDLRAARSSSPFIAASPYFNPCDGSARAWVRHVAR